MWEEGGGGEVGQTTRRRLGCRKLCQKTNEVVSNVVPPNPVVTFYFKVTECDVRVIRSRCIRDA